MVRTEDETHTKIDVRVYTHTYTTETFSRQYVGLGLGFANVHGVMSPVRTHTPCLQNAPSKAVGRGRAQLRIAMERELGKRKQEPLGLDSPRTKHMQMARSPVKPRGPLRPSRSKNKKNSFVGRPSSTGKSSSASSGEQLSTSTTNTYVEVRPADSRLAAAVSSTTATEVLRGEITQQLWSDAEEKALVEFILLYGEGSSWPATKDDKYWESAAKFVHERGGIQRRTGEDVFLYV